VATASGPIVEMELPLPMAAGDAASAKATPLTAMLTAILMAPFLSHPTLNPWQANRMGVSLGLQLLDFDCMPHQSCAVISAS